MKTNYLLAFIFLILFSNRSSANADVKNVIIITNAGERIQGTIFDKSWNRNPSSFTIKLLNGESKEYTPSQINSLKIDSGDYYISAYVPMDMNYFQSQDISTVQMGKIETDSVFLRVLVEAPLSLYLFKDANGKDHFYLKKGDEAFEELIDKKHQMYHEGQYVVQQLSTYKNRVKKAMQDCVNCIEEINKLEYTENSLQKSFLNYNKQINSGKITYTGMATRFSMQIWLLAGVDATMISFEGEDHMAHLSTGEFSNSILPSLSLRLSFPLSRLRNRNFVNVDINWKEYKSESSYTFESYHDYDIKIHMRYLRFAPSYTYKFSNKNVIPYLTIGLSASYLVSSSCVKHQHDHDPNLSAYYNKEFDGEAYEDPFEFDFGIFAAAGIEWKRFLLEFKYETYTGFITQANLDQKVNSYCAILGYRFK